MQFRLRTLLILLAVLPPVLWAAYRIGKPAILQEWRQWNRPVPGTGEIYYYHPDDHI